MGKKASERPILGGPYILVYQLANKLPGNLPNEIILKHPLTKARAVYCVNPETVVMDGPETDRLYPLLTRRKQ